MDTPGSVLKDPRTGPSLCTHLHIETWLLLTKDFSALKVLLSERPEKRR